MAEAFLKSMTGDDFEVESAGIEPGPLNPLAVEVMTELGLDISKNATKSVFDLYKAGKLYSYVITVCDESSQRCPIFPGNAKQIRWSFDDPSMFTGTREDKLRKTRKVRDQIRERVEAWLKELS